MDRLTLINHWLVRLVVAFTWLALWSATPAAAQGQTGRSHRSRERDQGERHKGCNFILRRTKRVDWSPPYSDAMEKYSSQHRPPHRRTPKHEG